MHIILSGLVEFIVKVGPYLSLFTIACAGAVVLLSALQYKGEPLTKNEPFGWAHKYPRFRTNPIDRAYLDGA